MKATSSVATAAESTDVERTALLRLRELLTNPQKRTPSEKWEPNWKAISGPNWRSYEGRGGIMELSARATPMQVSIEMVDRERD